MSLQVPDRRLCIVLASSPGDTATLSFFLLPPSSAGPLVSLHAQLLPRYSCGMRAFPIRKNLFLHRAPAYLRVRPGSQLFQLRPRLLRQQNRSLKTEKSPLLARRRAPAGFNRLGAFRKLFPRGIAGASCLSNHFRDHLSLQCLIQSPISSRSHKMRRLSSLPQDGRMLPPLKMPRRRLYRIPCHNPCSRSQ